jgi:hypothetical protein
MLDAVRRGAGTEETERLLTAEIGLSEDDAALAMDRAMGGLVRAGTRNRVNCPDPEEDPIAWETFERGMKDRSLVKLVRR